MSMFCRKKNLKLNYTTMMRQAPISRMPSVHDTRSLGKTTMIPQKQHKRMPPNAAHDQARHEFFRGHALAGPSMRASMGGVGDSDHGYTARPAMQGGALKKSPLSGFSFGSESPHQSEPMRYRHGGVSRSHSFTSRMVKGRIPGV